MAKKKTTQKKEASSTQAFTSGRIVAAVSLFIIIAFAGYTLYESGMSGGSLSNGPDLGNLGNNPFGKTDQDAMTEVEGMMYLETADGRHVYAQTETIPVIIKGDSGGQEAVGFDAAVTYDKNILAFSTAEIQIENAEFFSKENEDGVYVGAIKKPASEALFVFEDVPLVQLVFNPETQGSVRLDLTFAQEATNESNIVLMNSKDALVGTEGIDLYIGRLATLTEGIVQTLAQTSLQVTVQSISGDTIGVMVTDGTAQETFTVTSSEEGEQREMFEAFGYVFEFASPEGQTIDVYYASVIAAN